MEKSPDCSEAVSYTHLDVYKRQPIMYSCKYLNFSRGNSDMELLARRVIQEPVSYTHLSEQDGSGFQLNDLQTMKISDAIAERGHDYYREKRVRYISLDKTRVRAIVEGTQPYDCLLYTSENGVLQSGRDTDG